ncbi:MAG TPA: hypothetical protein VMI12_19395 [Puia sp.]|nr:hypothetical protein [Puia sp.]
MKNIIVYFVILLTIPISFCFGQLNTNSTANTQNKNHFLWWNGHWSATKKNVFIINKDSISKGGTATVNPDGSVQVQGGGQDDWNKIVENGLNYLNDWIKQLNDPANNADLPSHDLNSVLLPDAQHLQQLWQDYKIEQGQDILSPDVKPGNGSTKGGSGINPTGTKTNGNIITGTNATGDEISAFCTNAKKDYDFVIKYYKDHRRDKANDLNIPAPPEFEYNCYACDSNIKKTFDTTISHYVRDFPHPEDTIMNKGLSLIKKYISLGLNKTTLTEEEDKALGPYIFGSGPCVYFDLDALSEAINGISNHLYFRAQKLVDKYHKHFKAAQAVQQTYYAVGRFCELSGQTKLNDDDPNAPQMSSIHTTDVKNIGQMFLDNFDFYFKKLKQNDWRQIGNINYQMELIRSAGMLENESGQREREDEYLQELDDIMNSFTLSVDMDVKVGKAKGYQISHVKGECKIGPDFQPNSNQCYKWVVLDDTKKIGNRYASKALPQIDCKLIANEISAPGPVPVYIGTKKYTVNLQGLRMEFCDEEKDTILLTNFYPDPPENGLWKVPNSYPANLGVTGAQFFENMEERKRLAESGKAQEAADKYQQQNEQMIAQMKSIAEQMKTEAGNKSAADYQKIMEMFNKVKESANNPPLAEMLDIDFEIPIQNNSPVLVDKKFDAKQINPKLEEALIYAFYTIHIENKTNAPKNNNTPKK